MWPHFITEWQYAPIKFQAKVKKKVGQDDHHSSSPQTVKLRGKSEFAKTTTVTSQPTMSLLGGLENPLSQFSGEPQIVESSAISQLTPREPTSPVASSGPSLSRSTTTDFIKGTWAVSSLSCIIYRENLYNPSLSELSKLAFIHSFLYNFDFFCYNV